MKHLVEQIVKNIHIKCTIEVEKEHIVVGEMESIRRVFVNLITNAVEAMDKDGHLRVSILTSKKWIRTDVIDNGPGVSGEDLKHILTPFFTTKERGTGLGLAIVSKIVEEHNGKIEIESEIGKGTTVQVYLPKGRRKTQRKRKVVESK